MFRLVSDISIGVYDFSAVVEVEVASGWDELTDTCTLTFPRKAIWRGKALASGADPLLKRGDQVTVRLGYDETIGQVFEGYISKLMADIPVKIECQDAAYLLKRGTVSMSWREVKLDALLKAVLPSQVPFTALDVNLGQFRISKATPAEVLAYLREKYLLKSWFRGGRLYCGFAYVPELQRTHVIRFERNVVSHNLEYLRKDDVKIKLKAISMKPDNKKVDYETGDPEGEQRTLHFYNVSEATLKELANKEIERLKYEGYRGSLTTFLVPQIQHGDVVDLRSVEYPERDGRYFVRSVKTSFGMNGGRQTIELDSKLGQ